MDYDADILRLARVFAGHADIAVSTVSRRASGSGATFRRLEGGAGITLQRARKILQWFSDQWCLELDWPPDIPRPDPGPDAVCYAGARGDSSRHPPTPNGEASARDAARPGALNDAGELADVAAFARHHRFNVRNVRNVLARYGAGGRKCGHMPRRRDRRGIDTEAWLIMEALFEAGDARVRISKMGYEADKVGRALGL